MPPKTAKQNDSKKTQQKKKQQLIDDKTFGLKNKNKSKKVQQQIKSIEKNVLNSGDAKLRRLEEQRRQAKETAKLRKKALEDEQNALFGEALLAIQKKNTTDQKSGRQEAAGRDANEEAKKGTSRAMKMMFQMDATEMAEKLKEDPSYVPTLEDEIEDERQRKVTELKALGQGTPVTPETFAAWQDRKRKAKSEEYKKMVEAELRKKKGKGLSVLSGRALYEYRQELFADRDDDDMDTTASAAVSRQTSKITDTGDGADDAARQVDEKLFLEGTDDDLDDIDDEDDEN